MVQRSAAVRLDHRGAAGLSGGVVALRVFSPASAAAVTGGCRLDGWADDYPADGDRFVAGRVASASPPWCHYQVVETASGLVVGGAGFHGPPQHGEVEIGYGIVGSRQGLGYATGAAALLVDLARLSGGVTAVVATTDADNVASQRVLTKAGFSLVGAEGATLHYALRL